MRFFYADANQKTVGPMSGDDVLRLYRAGTLQGDTPLIEEGSTSWSTIDRLLSSAASSSAAYQPSSGAAYSTRARDHVAAPQAPLRGAEPLAPLLSIASTSDKAVVFGSSAAVLAMLLPWGSLFGSSISGLALAGHAPLLWLHPISFIGCLAAHQRLARASAPERLLAMRYVLAVAAGWTAIGAALISVGSSVLSSAGIGLYVALVGSASVAYGAGTDIRHQVMASI